MHSGIARLEPESESDIVIGERRTANLQHWQFTFTGL